ncbi:MAG: hypothetical protein ACI3Y0_10810 [Prevotella sp.]
MRVRQREIVEVPFILPDGRVLVHPGLVVSSDELQEIEDGLICFIKERYFDGIIDKIVNSIFG